MNNAIRYNLVLIIKIYHFSEFFILKTCKESD